MKGIKLEKNKRRKDQIPLSKGRSQWKGDGIIIKDEIATPHAWIFFSKRNIKSFHNFNCTP